MFRFTSALLLAVGLAHADISTTPSPEASLLKLAASADEAFDRPIDVTFSCANRPLGYYADIANDCKIYHVCNPQIMTDGKHVVMQYSFICPFGQTFEQKSQLCVVDREIPCAASADFYANTAAVHAGTTKIAQTMIPATMPAAVPEALPGVGTLQRSSLSFATPTAIKPVIPATQVPVTAIKHFPEPLFKPVPELGLNKVLRIG